MPNGRNAATERAIEMSEQERRATRRFRLGLRSVLPLALAALLLAACGTEHDGKRIAGATLLGAGLGAAGGPIGVGVGAGVGAIAGVLMPKGLGEAHPTTESALAQ